MNKKPTLAPTNPPTFNPIQTPLQLVAPFMLLDGHAHSVHSVLLKLLAYVPIGHSMQLREPGMEAKLPGGHVSQSKDSPEEPTPQEGVAVGREDEGIEEGREDEGDDDGLCVDGDEEDGATEDVG